MSIGMAIRPRWTSFVASTASPLCRCSEVTVFGRIWLKDCKQLCAAAGLEERNRRGMKLRGFGRARSALQSDDPDDIYGPELQGFAQRVANCNAGRERRSEFLPFKVQKDTLGYIHNGFVQHLKRFPEVFIIEERESSSGLAEGFASGSVSLVQSLSSYQMRTEAVKGVLEILRDDGVITGWRNELLPILLHYEAPPFLSMERAAVPLFGAKTYGIHINGHINADGEKFIWVARRSVSKPTFPGMLDHIAAGGQPLGISAKDNCIKECEEEAGIPAHLAQKAVAVGAVSYDVITGITYQRVVLFCYDLELPLEFEPCNRDGEVQSFSKLPVSEVMDIISKTEQYKPNCSLVVIHFLIRHGYITPEHKGYLSLLRSLNGGEL